MTDTPENPKRPLSSAEKQQILLRAEASGVPHAPELARRALVVIEGIDLARGLTRGEMVERFQADRDVARLGLPAEETKRAFLWTYEHTLALTGATLHRAPLPAPQSAARALPSQEFLQELIAPALWPVDTTSLPALPKPPRRLER